jgi:hypothetical protein
MLHTSQRPRESMSAFKTRPRILAWASAGGTTPPSWCGHPSRSMCWMLGGSTSPGQLSGTDRARLPRRIGCSVMNKRCRPARAHRDLAPPDSHRLSKKPTRANNQLTQGNINVTRSPECRSSPCSFRPSVVQSAAAPPAPGGAITARAPFYIMHGSIRQARNLCEQTITLGGCGRTR